MSLPRLLLIAVLLLASAGHAAEIALSTPRIDPSSDPHFRFTTAVASSGHGYLVAWEERYMEFYPPGAIMVRAFDERGRPLRPAATFLGGGVAPSIAWNGHEYLVVFGQRGSKFGSVLPLSVAAMTRVSEDGVPIDREPVVIAKQLNAFTYATSVAWNGLEYLVCWNGYTRGAVLVSRDLEMRPLDVTVFGWPTSVASNGTEFEIAGLSDLFTHDAEVRLMDIDSAGNAGAVRVVGTGQSASLTAVDGDYELLWRNDTGLQAAIVTADLHPKTLTAFPIEYATIASTNGAVVAGWTEYPHAPGVYTTRICTERLDVATEPRCSDETAGLQHDSAIGVSTDTILLAWSDRTSGFDDVRIDVSAKGVLPLATAGGQIASEAAAAQGAPAVARRADGGIAAAWTEVSPVTRREEIHFGGLDAHGVPLPDRGISPAVHDQYDPQISTANGRSLVTWNDVIPGQTKRIGIVVDDGNAVSAPIAFDGNTGRSAIAFDGVEWLVAWIDGNIRFCVIDHDGKITRTGSINEAFSPLDIAAAGGDGRFVVAWPEGETKSLRVSQIVAGNAEPATSLDTGTSNFVLTMPAVAVHGTRTLVSWLATSSSVLPGELRQALLDEHGARLTANSALTWRPYVYRMRARSTPAGFGLLTANAIVLTSLDGHSAGVIDVSTGSAIIWDFLAEAADRFTIAYSRHVTPDENLGLTDRAFIRTVAPARNRAARMR